MARKVTSEEVRGVFAEPADIRYKYFCVQILDSEFIWYAKIDDLVFTASLGGEDYIALWSDLQFAKNALSERHPNASFHSISLSEFMEQKLPSLDGDIDLAIMVSSDGYGQPVKPLRLLADLKRIQAGFLSNQIESGRPGSMSRLLRRATKSGPKGRLP